MDMTLFAQTVSFLLPTAWLVIGVRDNILYPDVNESITSLVLSLGRLEQEFPEEFGRMSHRRIESRATQKRLFRLIVAAELVVTLVMCVGVLALIGALLGWIDAWLARDIAIVGAVLFSSIWAGFVVVGNHFVYWYCHEGAQHTHFQLLLWGLGNVILLSI